MKVSLSTLSGEKQIHLCITLPPAALKAFSSSTLVARHIMEAPSSDPAWTPMELTSENVCISTGRNVVSNYIVHILSTARPVV